MLVCESPWEFIDPVSHWSEFQLTASSELQQTISQMYSEQEVIGSRRHAKIVSCSLFCKPTEIEIPWEKPTLEFMQRIRVRQGRLTWWEAYAVPFLNNLRNFPKTHPETDLHLYLAEDLSWMIPFLDYPFLIIHLMNHSSLAASPGNIWRFLAHDLPGVEEVQFSDIEDDWTQQQTELQCRIEKWRQSGLALFRHSNPVEFNPEVPDWLIYRPLLGGYFRLRPQAGFSMYQACVVMTWLAMENRLTTHIRHPQPERGMVNMFGRRFPNYGFDETILQHTLYPWYLPCGVFTSFHESQSETLFHLDLANAAKANPQSVVVRR